MFCILRVIIFEKQLWSKYVNYIPCQEERICCIFFIALISYLKLSYVVLDNLGINLFVSYSRVLKPDFQNKEAPSGVDYLNQILVYYSFDNIIIQIIL